MNELKDIFVPDPVSWTPQTWAWYLLFAAVLLAAVSAVWLFLRHRRANRYRRLALAEIESVDRMGAWHVLPALVKRVALQAWPRERVAALTGPEWLAFLDESYGGNGFTAGSGRCLADLAYGGGDGAAAVEVVRDWIRKHHA